MQRAALGERGLIVSCQALPGEPLYGKSIMVNMALAAEEGGAIGIRANGAEDIAGIKAAVKLPVIGLIKRKIPGSDIYITPSMEEVKEILEAGADIVALDMTDREERMAAVEKMIPVIHRAGAKVMADVSILREGILAEKLGADFISTTLSGYTPYSPRRTRPDYRLIEELAGAVSKPVIAEGRISGFNQAIHAMKAGATYIVVGSAITRPQMITRTYADAIGRWFQNKANTGLRI